MTYQELIYRAVEQAQRGLDPNRSKLMDAEGIAEVMLPSVFHEIATRCAHDEKLRSVLSSPFTVTFTNGVATLTDTVLTEYLCESTLRDTADRTKRYSHILNWGDFVRPRSPIDKKFGWYAMQGGVTLAIVEPNADYTDGAGLTGSRNLTCPRVPAIPANATTEVDSPEEVTDEIINVLAEMLRGKLLAEAA